MTANQIDIMEASAQQLVEIEGITSEMAEAIITKRNQQKFIDLHSVAKITGIPRKALKATFLEPSPFDIWQVMLQESQASTDVKLLTQLTETNKELVQVKEVMGDLTQRMYKVEQTQLMGSTIQFKDP